MRRTCIAIEYRNKYSFLDNLCNTVNNSEQFQVLNLNENAPEQMKKSTAPLLNGNNNRQSVIETDLYKVLLVCIKSKHNLLLHTADKNDFFFK